jgi:hypothetical protein
MPLARHGRYDDYDYYDGEDLGGDIVEAMCPLLERARRFVEGRDTRGALDFLEALTDEYVTGYGSLNHHNEISTALI